MQIVKLFCKSFRYRQDFFGKFESNRLETNLASYLIRLFLLHIIQVVHVHVSFGSP